MKTNPHQNLGIRLLLFAMMNSSTPLLAHSPIHAAGPLRAGGLNALNDGVNVAGMPGEFVLDDYGVPTFGASSGGQEWSEKSRSSGGQSLASVHHASVG